MTGPSDDSQKKKSDDAAKYLAESFFGLNMTPADVGGEVLFDDYDDVKTPSGSLFAQLDTEETDVVSPSESRPFSSTDLRAAAPSSPEDSFEENLDDLIVFSDEDDDDDVSVVVAARDEEEDENFDFGDEDDDDEEDDDLDEDDEDEEFDDDDEEDEDDEDEDDDDEEFDDDFGAEIDGPQKRRASAPLPQARSEQSGRSHDSGRRSSLDRPAPSRGQAAQPSAPTFEERDRSRSERSREDSDRSSSPRAGRGAARSESPREVSNENSARSEQRKSSPVDSTGNDDDTYWQELDRWVWEDKDPKKKVTAAAEPDELDEDEVIDEEDIVVTGTGPRSATVEDEESDDQPKKRRRGRRRGGRGRGSRQTDSSRPSADVDESAAAVAGRYVDDDLSEILFEEDQEDIVSVSAGSVQAQRRIREEPPAPPVRKPEPEALDEDEQDDDDRGSDDRPSARRRGRRGRRGRGRSSDTPLEAAAGSERPAPTSRRPPRDEVEDSFEDDDEFLDADARETGFEDVEEPAPRTERGRRPQPERGRGRHRDETQERTSSESREPRERESASFESDRPSRRPGSRDRAPSRESDGDRQSSREARVAPEFRDIPTWEDAIACLSLRTPTEDHARRTENRGRGSRDSGRPPRRR